MPKLLTEHAPEPGENRVAAQHPSSLPAGKRTAGFHGKEAEKYARSYSAENAGGHALRVRRETVIELFDQPGGRVLDVGCGPAPVAQDLLDRRCEYWGMDASPTMIEICRRRFAENEKTHFLLGDAKRLSFPDNFFDAVLCIGVFDSLPHRPETLREILRVLKPRGTLIMSFANLRSPYAWWKAYVFYPALSLARRFVGLDADHPAIFVRRHLHSRKTASGLVNRAGARVERVVGYYYNILLSPLDEIWPAAALWLVKRFEDSRRPLPSWLPVGFILKAVKD